MALPWPPGATTNASSEGASSDAGSPVSEPMPILPIRGPSLYVAPPKRAAEHRHRPSVQSDGEATIERATFFFVRRRRKGNVERELVRVTVCRRAIGTIGWASATFTPRDRRRARGQRRRSAELEGLKSLRVHVGVAMIEQGARGARTEAADRVEGCSRGARAEREASEVVKSARAWSAWAIASRATRRG